MSVLVVVAVVVLYGPWVPLVVVFRTCLFYLDGLPAYLASQPNPFCALDWEVRVRYQDVLHYKGFGYPILPHMADVD